VCCQFARAVAGSGFATDTAASQVQEAACTRRATWTNADLDLFSCTEHRAGLAEITGEPLAVPVRCQIVVGRDGEADIQCGTPADLIAPDGSMICIEHAYATGFALGRFLRICEL